MVTTREQTETMVSPPASPVDLDVATLFAENGRFVGRVIRRLVGEGPHVDDLLQETFVIAHKKRREFGGRSSAQTWLYGIAANLCRHHVRSNQRSFLFFSKWRERQTLSETEPEWPDIDIERREAVSYVHALLSRLPMKYREVIVLFELEEKDAAEIAAFVGIREGAVWTRLHRARNALRRLTERDTKRRLS